MVGDLKNKVKKISNNNNKEKFLPRELFRGIISDLTFLEFEFKESLKGDTKNHKLFLFFLLPIYHFLEVEFSIILCFLIS